MATCDAKRGGAYGRRCCARMCSASLGWRRVRVTGHECDLEACCMQKRCSSARMKFQRLTTARLATDRPLVATMHCNTWPATRNMLAPAAWATAGAVPAALTAPDAWPRPQLHPTPQLARKSPSIVRPHCCCVSSPRPQRQRAPTFGAQPPPCVLTWLHLDILAAHVLARVASAQESIDIR